MKGWAGEGDHAEASYARKTGQHTTQQQSIPKAHSAGQQQLQNLSKHAFGKRERWVLLLYLTAVPHCGMVCDFGACHSFREEGRHRPDAGIEAGSKPAKMQRLTPGPPCRLMLTVRAPL